MKIPEPLAIELVKIIPSTLWVLLAGVIILVFYRSIRDNLLPKLSGIKVGGAEFSFVKEFIDAAVKLADKSPLWEIVVSPEEKDCVMRRAKRHSDLFRDVQVLWIDDHPENSINERKMFRQLKMEIDVAESTQMAIDMLGKGTYDLILSDMSRGSANDAGIQFLKALIENHNPTPVIFYVGVYVAEKGIPPHAFGITNRPDELLHLVLDALERRKS